MTICYLLLLTEENNDRVCYCGENQWAAGWMDGLSGEKVQMDPSKIAISTSFVKGNEREKKLPLVCDRIMLETKENEWTEWIIPSRRLLMEYTFDTLLHCTHSEHTKWRRPFLRLISGSQADAVLLKMRWSLVDDRRLLYFSQTECCCLSGREERKETGSVSHRFTEWLFGPHCKPFPGWDFNESDGASVTENPRQLVSVCRLGQTHDEEEDDDYDEPQLPT